MTIRGLLEIGLYDENEQVVILSGEVSSPVREFTGRLVNTPAELLGREIEQVSAMGETRRDQYKLNKYGWTEIWIEE